MRGKERGCRIRVGRELRREWRRDRRYGEVEMGRKDIEDMGKRQEA